MELYLYGRFDTMMKLIGLRRTNQGFLMLYLENIKRLLIIIFSFRIKIWIVNKIKI